MLNKKIILAAVAVSFMLFSGCSSIYGTGSSNPLENVTKEVGSCASAGMGFGVGKMPCCNKITDGKCDELIQLDPGITYAKSSPANPNEACSIDGGTCANINLKMWNTSAPESTAKAMENKTINLCPTFVKSVCMENCTTGIFRDISINENPGLSPGDIHQLRLIYGNNATQISNNTNDNSLSVKRLNLLYSEGSYQMIDDRVANDLKGNAVMDIFRFGVGKTFAEFDEAQVLLPFSTEEIGEVSQSGVESFALYYYPKDAIRNCVMDIAQFGYVCKNASSAIAYNKVFPTFESCLLNCVGNSNRLRPSGIESLNMIMKNKPAGKDALVESFYVQNVSSLNPPNSRKVPNLDQIRSYVNSMGSRSWQPVVRKNVSGYLLDEFGSFGDSFTITADNLSFSNATRSLSQLNSLANVYYQVNDIKSGYGDITSRYDSSTYNYSFSLVDGKEKPGLPFECSKQDCKSGMCSFDTHYRTGCIGTADANADVKCGCDGLGCYQGSQTGANFSKTKLAYYEADNCSASGMHAGIGRGSNYPIPISESNSAKSESLTKTVMSSDKQYMAIPLDFGFYPTLVDNASVCSSLNMETDTYSEQPGVGCYWWTMIYWADGGKKPNACDRPMFFFYDGCKKPAYTNGNIAPGVSWYYDSNWATASDGASSQLFGYMFDLGGRGCKDDDRDYSVQYQYIELGDRLIQDLQNYYYDSSLFRNLPIVKSCGMDENDEHYVCVNPAVLNSGGNIMKAFEGANGDHAGRIYGCRLVQSISGLTIAEGTGMADSKTPTIASSRLTSATCTWPETYAFMNSGTVYANSDPSYSTYQIQISGTKGVCENLTQGDFCLETGANGKCAKEALTMVLLNPGPDKKYGNCTAANGATPDVRQYGMCENPSYVNLAVQVIAPDNLYFPNDTNNFGYIPASQATNVSSVVKNNFKPNGMPDSPRTTTTSILVAYATDPKGKNVQFSILPNVNDSGDAKNASANFWPPVDYLRNKTRSYLQGGISVMLFAEHPGLYSYCGVNGTSAGGNYCKKDSSPPFMSKLLNDLYNQSNVQKSVPVGSAIVVTGRATPVKKECQTIKFNTTSSLDYCDYYREEERYNSTYYATTEDLAKRNKQVKDVCPGCRTAIEIAGNLRDTGSGFVIETQTGNEGEMLQMTFKRNPIQVNITDIYNKYGVTQRPNASIGTICKSGAAFGPGSIAPLTANCGIGYRALDGTKKYGEGLRMTKTVTNTYSTMAGGSYTLPSPNSSTVTVSGYGKYTTTRDQQKACSTIKDYAAGKEFCSLTSVNALEYFDFMPDKKVWYSWQVAYPFDGWHGIANDQGCDTTHHVEGWGDVTCPADLKFMGVTVYSVSCDCYASAGPHTYTDWSSVVIPGMELQLAHKELTCSTPTCADPVATIGETCTAKPNCINMPSFSTGAPFPASGTCSWAPYLEAGCNSCGPEPTRSRVERWGAMQVNCDTTVYPADFIAYYNTTLRTPAKLAKLEEEIRVNNSNNNAGIDTVMCKRDSDIRTYSLGEGCNGLYNSTDMLVLNLEIDPTTAGYSAANYEAWYTAMADAIVNYSSGETYTYGKPIVIYIRDMKNAPGFDPAKFMTVLGLNMERMINAGVVAIQFEDWKKATADNVNAYTTDAGTYNGLLYPFNASGAPTPTFSALSELGKAISKKINFPMPKPTPVYDNVTCLNSTIPCIADSACITQASIGSKKITCYNGTGAVKIVYSMTPSASEEDMKRVFADPDKYKNVISSVNRYSNWKLCNSSVANSTYFMSYMSNPGYGIPLAWDQLQNQTCTATGLTNAETLSYVTGGATDYVCRLE